MQEHIEISIGGAYVKVPCEAAALAYIEQMIDLRRPLPVLLDRTVGLEALVPPFIGAYWEGQGGHYAGVGRSFDGKSDFYIIVPPMPKLKTNHEDALKRAAQVEVDGHQDFRLLTKAVAPICYGNVPELFEKDWHWLADPQDADAGYAWIQTFSSGNQYWDPKGTHHLVRAFRRQVIE